MDPMKNLTPAQDEMIFSAMKRPTHTPGPWRLGDHRLLSVDIVPAKSHKSPTRAAIASVHSPSGLPEDLDETEANARLIAAAPDLLAACRVVDAFRQLLTRNGDALTRTPGFRHLAEVVDAAIAKAEGAR